MEPKEDTPEDHKRRSRFVKRLVQSSTGKETPLVGHPNGIPKTIVQFWDNSYQLPTSNGRRGLHRNLEGSRGAGI
jgi:hypothetical protein